MTKDKVLRYRPEHNDRLIQCMAADGMVRIAFIEGTNLVRVAKNLLKLSRVATAALGRQLMMTAIMSADLLIVGGTSLSVYPAAGLIDAYRGTRLVLINRTATQKDARANLVFREPIGELLGKID